MVFSDKNLAKFREWVLAGGRVEGTADLYCTHLRKASADRKGLTHRLIASDLAPNTKHSILAALRAWALFSEDEKLAQQLKTLRLPPARRVHRKIPLDVALWRKMVRHLQGCRMRNEAVRQVLLVIALRGLRGGDVLRLKRSEILTALDTGELPYEGKGRKRMAISAATIRGPLQALADHPGKWERVRDLVSRSKDPKVASVRVWRAARATAKEAGVLQMNPHRYRHTFATNFLAEIKGDPNAIVKLQRHMGWENMATAARYVEEISTDELDAIGAGMVGDLIT